MKVEVRIGDLSVQSVEAAIRSVSSELEPVTPLARELGLAAGVGILDQVRAQGEFPVGGALVTSGGESAATYLIHVVVQSAEEPITPSSVRRALLNGLRRAAQFGISTLALPPLGTGAGNLEAEGSAGAVVRALEEHRCTEKLPGTIRIIVTTEYERSAFTTRLGQAGLLDHDDETEGEGVE